MTIVVTGASGLVGRFAVRALNAQGHAVVGIDIVEPSGMPSAGVFERTDLARPEAWFDLLARHRPAAVIHLGALTTQASERDPIGALRTNVMSCGYLFEAARVLGSPRIIYASTVGVYAAPSCYGEPAHEGALIGPGTLYAATKAMSEALAAHYSSRHGVASTGLRLTVAYGPGRYSGGIGQINRAIRSAIMAEPFEWRRHFASDCVHNPIHVTDVGTAFVRAATGPLLPRSVYNLGGRETLTEAEMMEIIRQEAERPEQFAQMPDSGDLLVTYAPVDCSAFHRDADLGPAISLREAISWTRRYYADPLRDVSS